MARAINVKIATAKVIKSLEEKLVKIQKDKANEKENQEKFNKELEKWRKAVIKIASTNIAKASHTSVNKRYDGTINLDLYFSKDTLDVPAEPEPDHKVLPDWQHKEMVEELENAIRILKMTDEEYVNASTMKSISKYL